jgi:peptidylprolyl isomerase
MKTVRILADIPIMERPKVHVMAGSALNDLITKIRLQKGADFSICDVVIPARIE